MNIIFDTRETKLLSYINNTNEAFSIMSESLDIGDIHLYQPIIVASLFLKEKL